MLGFDLDILDLLNPVMAPAISKIITVSPGAALEQIITAAQAGVNGYVVKPFTAATLKEKIEKIFERLN